MISEDQSLLSLPNWLRISELFWRLELPRECSQCFVPFVVICPLPLLMYDYSRGDYKSGKRINMRKIIAFVASGYRKDAIWMRRTKLSERDYQVRMRRGERAGEKRRILSPFCVLSSRL